MDTPESDRVREERGKLGAEVEVDDAVLGRDLDRCSSLNFNGTEGFRGDGDDGRELGMGRG